MRAFGAGPGPGLLLVTAVAAAAWLAGGTFPLVGAPVFALLLGVAIRGLRAPAASFAPGIAFAARYVLQAAIVCSGLGLSLGAIASTSAATLPVALVTIGLALGLAPLVGRALGIGGRARELIGVGTAICGASAIAAVATVIEPTETELALSIATIFFYNVVAVLVFPVLGHALHLSQEAFGVWAGTAINDTSSVLAAAYAYGKDAGAEATVVKLARATLILPVVAGFALAAARNGPGRSVAWSRIVPWFIVWFLVAALLNTSGLVPLAVHAAAPSVSAFLIAVALAGIGLQTPPGALLAAGPRPLALGFVLWAAVASASLVMQSGWLR